MSPRSSSAIGHDLENRVVRHLRSQGYVVHRVIRHSARRAGRWYNAGTDIWGCIDILAKRHGERIRFIQVTSGSLASKRSAMEEVPWDTCFESVELWRHVKPKPGRRGHFQVYLLDEGFAMDASNRVEC